MLFFFFFSIFFLFIFPNRTPTEPPQTPSLSGFVTIHGCGQRLARPSLQPCGPLDLGDASLPSSGNLGGLHLCWLCATWLLLPESGKLTGEPSANALPTPEPAWHVSRPLCRCWAQCGSSADQGSSQESQGPDACSPLEEGWTPI